MKDIKILLTAFDPFGNESTNAVLEAINEVNDMSDVCRLTKLVLPTAFQKGSQILIEKARELHPDAIIMLGQATGRHAITPERVAINIMDATIPDNENYSPVDVPIIEGAPDAYFSTLPIKEIVAALKDKDIPSAVSNTAGTFVCNQTMYSILHFSRIELPQAKVGFIHIPCTPKQAEKGTPSMEVSIAARGIESAIKTVVQIIEKQKE